MAKSAQLLDSDSVAVIEISGAVNLARLLQAISAETRARLIGATAASAAGVTTVVIAGGLAEVQHASTHVRSFSGVSDSVFFAKPDLSALAVLLQSLNLAVEPVAVEKPVALAKQRVRSIEELDISEIEEWNVHELRRYARSLPDFPLHGREISKAHRQELLSLFEAAGILAGASTTSRLFASQQQVPS
jgi:hypothetical protein